MIYASALLHGRHSEPRVGMGRRRRTASAPAEGSSAVGALFRTVYASSDRGAVRFPSDIALCLDRLDAID